MNNSDVLEGSSNNKVKVMPASYRSCWQWEKAINCPSTSLYQKVEKSQLLFEYENPS